MCSSGRRDYYIFNNGKGDISADVIATMEAWGLVRSGFENQILRDPISSLSRTEDRTTFNGFYNGEDPILSLFTRLQHRSALAKCFYASSCSITSSIRYTFMLSSLKSEIVSNDLSCLPFLLPLNGILINLEGISWERLIENIGRKVIP